MALKVDPVHTQTCTGKHTNHTKMNVSKKSLGNNNSSNLFLCALGNNHVMFSFILGGKVYLGGCGKLRL